MKKINNIEKITNTYTNWKATDIAFIKKIEWSPENLEIVFYAQLRQKSVWPDFLGPFFEISISFENVSQFKLEIYGKGLHQISGCDIVDISSDNLENINFHIEDYENGTINFYCKEVSVNYVSESFKLTS